VELPTEVLGLEEINMTNVQDQVQEHAEETALSNELVPVSMNKVIETQGMIVELQKKIVETQGTLTSLLAKTTVNLGVGVKPVEPQKPDEHKETAQPATVVEEKKPENLFKKMIRLFLDKDFYDYLRKNLHYQLTVSETEHRNAILKSSVLRALLYVYNYRVNDNYICGTHVGERLKNKKLGENLQTIFRDWVRKGAMLDGKPILTRLETNLAPAGYKGNANSNTIWFQIHRPAFVFLEKLIREYKG
jgi:hypothetical protein